MPKLSQVYNRRTRTHITIVEATNGADSIVIQTPAKPTDERD